MIPNAWRQGEVAVIGLGKSGAAATGWLRRQGIAVYASDAATSEDVGRAAAALAESGAAIETGRHDLDRIARAVAVVASPGVPPDAAPLAAARAAGVSIVGELDLAVQVLDTTRLIAVTGTNGKTTTTALVAQLLEAGGLQAAAAGNIGRPLIELAADPVPYDWIAVEVSSFQLHDAPNLAPAIGVVTNLAPDHLDRYMNVADYYADKQHLFQHATTESVWVLNGDDAGVLTLAGRAPGRRRLFSLQGQGDAVFDRGRDALVLDGAPLIPRASLALLGDHNVANALAAVLAAEAAGVARDALAQGLRAFRPLPHRLEPVGETGGVRWINDSKATNVAAAVVGARAMTGPYVLLMGGRHKGEPYDALRAVLAVGCRGVVAYGEAAPRIAAGLKGAVPVERVERFDDAVRRAGDLAQPGDVVLLSPACSSYDQFHDYEERGNRFRALVPVA